MFGQGARQQRILAQRWLCLLLSFLVGGEPPPAPAMSLHLCAEAAGSVGRAGAAVIGACCARCVMRSRECGRLGRASFSGAPPGFFTCAWRLGWRGGALHAVHAASGWRTHFGMACSACADKTCKLQRREEGRRAKAGRLGKRSSKMGGWEMKGREGLHKAQSECSRWLRWLP